MTAIATIIGAHLVMRGEVKASQPQQLQVAYDRIERLEIVNADLSGRVVMLSTQLGLLKASIEIGGQDPRSFLFSFLEKIHQPAWVKQYDPISEEFRMLFINTAYSTLYGVSEDKYVGATDYEVFDEKRADEFYRNDLAVMASKDFYTFNEEVVIDGKPTTARFWKFFIEFPDGSQGVAGLQIRPDVASE